MTQAEDVFAHFEPVPQFSGRHIFTQRAILSSKNIGSELWFDAGEEVAYHTIQYPRDKRAAALIFHELEEPSFLPESEQMPYDVETLHQLMRIPDATSIVAWKKGVKSTDPPRLVGYLIGAPYKQYPSNLHLTPQDITTIDGKILPLPDDHTLMFDTFAVAQGERGKHIGQTLLELLLQKLNRSKTLYKVATFAVNHELSHTNTMMHSHPVLHAAWEAGDGVEGVVPYRGITATYMLVDLSHYKDANGMLMQSVAGSTLR